MAKKSNLPDRKDPPPLTKLSKKALQEMTRPYAKRAIEITAELMENADNDSVRLGAAKTILAKVLPDLKSTDLTSEGDRIQSIDVGSLIEKAYGNKSEGID